MKLFFSSVLRSYAGRLNSLGKALCRGKFRHRLPRSSRARNLDHIAADVLEVRQLLSSTLLGQSLFPADNPWNQNISQAPVAANSAAIISHIGASIHVHPDWGTDNPANGASPLYGIPFNVVHGNSTPKINVVIDVYPSESDITPVPIPANAVLEGDYQNGPNPNVAQRGDSHLIVWDEDNNIAYELYGVTRPTDATLFGGQPNTDGLWHAAQETVWDMNTNTFRTLGETSADAAGLSILAGLARPDEGLPIAQGGQGVITHALRMTLPSADINSQYIYPASHKVFNSITANNLPMGSRLRLADTPAIDTLISNMPPESQIIARAMQQYGLILADVGSAMFVTGTSASMDSSNNISLTWNMNDVLASNGLRALTAGDFEVVNLQPVVTGLSAAAGAPGTVLTITGQNFSGAAGHLSVLFGSTPATSVKILSDTQLSVVVPSGSGTVDVTVQSGQNQSALENIGSSGDNVNSPIFGYGTSAKTAADRFTFTVTTGPASPAQSVVSLSSASVASGSSVTVTLQAEDANGNKESTGGLTVTFALGSTSGGQGKFGSVTDNQNGTYTATFTGTTAGSNTVTATIGGQAVTSTAPSIKVTPGPASLAKSVVSLSSSTVVSGSSVTVTLQVEDAVGNKLTSGGLTVAFALASTSGGKGTFSSVTDNHNGTYTATFTGTTAGSSTIKTTIGGSAVTSTAPSIAVTPGPPSLAKSLVSVAFPGVASGGTDKITLQTKDANGNNLSAGGLTVVFSLGSATGGQGTFSAVTDNHNGTYTATFTGTTAGNNTIKATIGGKAVTSTAPTITITAPASGSKSLVSVAFPGVASGGADKITLQTRDANGNNLTAGGLTVTFALGSASGGQGKFSSVTDNHNGTYTVTFTGTTAGSNTIKATIGGNAVNSTAPTITITAPASGSKSIVSLSSASVASGSGVTVTLQTKDANGNNLTAGGLTVRFALAGSSGGQGTFGSVTDNHNGTYTATFTGTIAGSNTIKATIAGSAVTSTAPSITITPGRVSLAKSVVSLSSSSVTSGSSVTVTLQAEDAAGNKLTTGGLTVAFALASTSGGQGTFGSVADNHNGTYTVTFTGTIAGSNTIKATIGGQALTSTAPSITVT